MDPISAILGIATGIAGLLKTGQTIYGWIESFKEADGNLRKLRLLLIEFDRLLTNLRHDLDDDKVQLRIPPEHTNIIIADAEETLQKLRSAIEAVRRGDENDARRLQWLLKEKRCQNLQQQLAKHRDSFQGIYNVILSAQIEYHRRLSENTLQLMREMHTMMAGNRPLLVQYSTEAAQAIDGEAEVMISQATEEMLTKVAEDHAEVMSDETIPYSSRAPSLVDQQMIQLPSDHVEPLTEDSEKETSPYDYHTGSKSARSRLEPKRKALSPKFATQFIRRGSNSGGPANEGPSRRMLVLSARKFKECLGLSLQARSFISPFRVRFDSSVPNDSDAIIFATATDIQALRNILQNGLTTVRDRDPDNWTMLHNAAYYGTAEQVKLLINSGSDLDVGDVGTRKPVHFALISVYEIDSTQADRDRLEAFPNWRAAKDDFEFTPVHIAVLGDYDIRDKERPSLLELLEFVDTMNTSSSSQSWSSWKKDVRQRSPLFGQIVEAFRQEADRLRRRGLSVKPVLALVDTPDARQKWTPFHWATATGRLDKMEDLLSKLANPFLISGTNRNALHLAAESKRFEVMEFLFSIPPDPIQGWFDINQQDQWEESPLHVAVYGKARDAVKCTQLLLENGARRDLPRKNESGTPLHLAAWSEEDVKLDLVDLLTADRGPHINARTNKGRTPIFGFLDNLECFEMLLDRGADISAKDNDGMTILHVACIENRFNVLKILLERSGNHALATMADKEGDTPIAKAIECKSVACAKLLLDANAVGDLHGKDGLTLVHRAIDMGDADFLMSCFEHPTYQKGVRTYDKMTIMEYAVRKDKYEGKIKELILKYESYGPRTLVMGGVNRQREADMARNEVRAAYFACK